jgi:hypothetical protein
MVQSLHSTRCTDSKPVVELCPTPLNASYLIRTCSVCTLPAFNITSRHCSLLEAYGGTLWCLLCGRQGATAAWDLVTSTSTLLMVY